MAGGERLSTVAVVGAGGSIGAPVSAELRRRGHEVRALSRSSSTYPVDLESGRGLAEALAGCEVVVDAANGGPRPAAARAVLVEGGRRLTTAAREAGVGHLIGLSIVGCDAVPLGYYRVKVEQEEGLVASGLPYSILRATQFHSLLDGLFTAARPWRLLPGGRALLQPVDPAEVAPVVADLAEAEPLRGRRTVAGPEALTLGELARRWLSARGARGLVVPVPLPPSLGRALRGGALIDPAPGVRGRVGFDRWLRQGGEGG